MDTHEPGAAAGVILTDCHAGTGQQGPMIIDGDGDLVWFKPLSDHGTRARRAFNLRVQRYRGRAVLSWFDGAVVGGHGEGHYVIADHSYHQIATVEAANGLHGDLPDCELNGRAATGSGVAAGNRRECLGSKLACPRAKNNEVERPYMKMLEIREDLRMVLDDGPGQAYVLRRGSEAVLIDTGIAEQGDSVAAALADWGLDRER
jgi:hypothetical protein